MGGEETIDVKTVELGRRALIAHSKTTPNLCIFFSQIQWKFLSEDGAI